MAFYKITTPFNTEDSGMLYFGCKWKVEEDGVYADVPDYCVESYVATGRVFANEKSVEKPKEKLKDVATEKLSAEDVVSGNTVAAVEKKEARAVAAEAAKPKAVEPKAVEPKAKAKVKPKVKSKGK